MKMTINFPDNDAIDMHLYRFSGTEGISRIFKYNLHMESEDDIDFADIVGKNVTVAWSDDGQTVQRHFNGMIVSLTRRSKREDYYHYQAVMVPRLWLLTRRVNYRIFQNQRIPDIVESILDEYKTDHKLEFVIGDIQSQTYADHKLDYCTQYGETDLNFISRLMEDGGLCYYFTHDASEHTMYIHDSYFDNYPEIYDSEANIVDTRLSDHHRTTDEINRWEHRQEIRSECYTIGDYSFKKITSTINDCKRTECTSPDLSQGLSEIYEYPGLRIVAEDQKDTMIDADAADLAGLRLGQETAAQTRITGGGNYRQFICGHQFIFEGSHYLLTRVTHAASQPRHRSGETRTTRYANTFTCIPIDDSNSSARFRPPRVTPKPVVQGPQTAIVVNDEGTMEARTKYTSGEGGQIDDETWVDEFGRVRVRFHWERAHDGERADDDDYYNSAWLRVSQAWAGQGWGAMHLPHVGQEVIVDFLEGDPDRPIVTGRVYNAKNQPYNYNADTADKHDTMDPKVNPRISGFRDEFGNRLIFNADDTDDEHRGIVLKTPEKESYLRLGKEGAQLKSKANIAKSYRGANLEYGIGTKAEALLGLDASFKLAQSYEVIIGQLFEMMIGNRVEVGVGTKWDYNFSKDLSTTEGDIQSETKKDYKLTAGDGLCLVGGALDKKHQNRSILNAYAEGMMLSFGPEKSTTKSTSDEYGGKILKLSNIVVSIAALVAGFYSAAVEQFDKDQESGFWKITKTGAAHAAISLAAFQALYSSLAFGMYKDKVEPSFHSEPLAYMGMNKEGISFGINPDLEKYKEEQKKVTKEIESKMKWFEKETSVWKKTQAQKELEESKEEEKEIWKKYLEGSLQGKGASSKIMMKDDGSVLINSDGQDWVKGKNWENICIWIKTFH
jgi:type VI secretion system secreted protein VgrG